MELTVQPTDLRAAAAALAACADHLEQAGHAFAQASRADVPEIGAAAAEAASRGVAAAERATETIGTDVRRLSEALSALATFYPQLDSTAVVAR